MKTMPVNKRVELSKCRIKWSFNEKHSRTYVFAYNDGVYYCPLCQDCCHSIKLNIGAGKRDLNGLIFAKSKELNLKKLLPPLNMTVSEVAHSEGISSKSLYYWRHALRKESKPVPGKALISSD